MYYVGSGEPYLNVHICRALIFPHPTMKGGMFESVGLGLGFGSAAPYNVGEKKRKRE